MLVVHLIKLRFKNLDALPNFRKSEHSHPTGENGEIKFVSNCAMTLSTSKMFKLVACTGK